MLEQKQKDYNWYYASFTFNDQSKDFGLRWYHFVIFAKTPTEAKKIGTEYAMTKIKDGEKPYSLNEPLNIYQKNYIRESRALVAGGHWCGEKPVTV